MNIKFINPFARFHLLAIFFLMCAFDQAAAQSNLAVASLFDGRYRNHPEATETVISGDALKQYKLSVFRSITLTGKSNEWQGIEKMVKRDGRSAINREENIVNGRLMGAFYELPKQGSKHRYLFYLNRIHKGEDKIMIIYIEGKASASEVRDLL